jgi:1,4-alpha-glucan branching enzyme
MTAVKSNLQKVVFSLLAPQAQSVFLAGSFNSWNRESHILRKQRNGLWKITLPLEPGRHEYRFLVDGQWVDDPMCDHKAPTPFGSENGVRMVGDV